MADTNTYKQKEQSIENKEAENPKEAQNVCDVSVPAIIAALHQKALAEATKKVTNCRIANSAIEDDGKTAKLKSAGEHIVTVFSKDKDGKILKADALTALKEYVHWFVGPDLEAKVTDKVIKPLVEKSEEEEGRDKAGGDEEPSEKSGEENNEEGEQNAEETQADESLFPMFSKFLKTINEANEDDFTDSEDEEGSREQSSTASSEDGNGNKDDSTKDGAEGESNEGYYIAYNLKVNGLKETKVKEAMEDLAKGLFDTLTFTASGLFGGGASFTGKDIRKKLHELKNIDVNKLAADVQKFLTKKFPGVSELKAYERDSKTLYKELAKYSDQFSKDQKTAISEAPYSLCVRVKEKDTAKPFLNAMKIAEAIRKCMAFFKIGSKMEVDKDSIIVINDYIDVNAHDQVEAEKRPTYNELKNMVLNVMADNDGKMSKSVSYKEGFKLFSDIKDVFQTLRTKKKAMEQDENIKAVKLFDEFEKKKGKEFDDTDHKFRYSDFEDFLIAYKKLDKSLKKESIEALDRYGIAKMLFEQLFGDHNGFSQLVCEKVPFDQLGKTTSKISELHKDGKLKYPKASVLDKDGKSTGQTQEIGDKEIANGLQYGVLEFDEKTNQLKVTDKKGLRIEADGTLLTPNEEKRKYGDLMSDEGDKSNSERKVDQEDKKESSSGDDSSKDNKSSSDKDKSREDSSSTDNTSNEETSRDEN